MVQAKRIHGTYNQGCTLDQEAKDDTMVLSMVQHGTVEQLKMIQYGKLAGAVCILEDEHMHWRARLHIPPGEQ